MSQLKQRGIAESATPNTPIRAKDSAMNDYTTNPPKPSLWTEDLPLVTSIHPPLAAEIGLNESLVLRQIAFWINGANHLRDGQWWTYQTLEGMKENAFPYWSVPTISRVINNLVERGLLHKSAEYNKRKNDRTQWFSLNIEGIQKLKSVKLVFQNAKQVKSGFQNENSIFQNEKTILQDETTLPKYIPEESLNKKDSSVDADLEAMTVAVKKELKQYGAKALRIAKMLLCRLTGKDKELNLEKAISLDEFRAFLAAWDKKVDRQGQRLQRPKNFDSLRSNIEIWRDSLSQPPMPVKFVPASRPQPAMSVIPAQSTVSDSQQADALAILQAGRNGGLVNVSA